MEKKGKMCWKQGDDYPLNQIYSLGCWLDREGVGEKGDDLSWGHVVFDVL